jgi:hypothetical protein
MTTVVAPSQPLCNVTEQVKPSTFQLLPSGPPPFHTRMPVVAAPVSDPHALVTAEGCSASIFTQSKAVKDTLLPGALDGVGATTWGVATEGVARRGYSGALPHPAIHETSSARIAKSNGSIGGLDTELDSELRRHGIVRGPSMAAVTACPGAPLRYFDGFVISGVSFSSLPWSSSVKT